MAHYAKVEDGVVTNVIVAEQDFIDTQEGTWVQTSYNTYGGVHTLGGTPLRKNYASIGCVYDSDRDAFYVPQPYPSWVLNEDTCLWAAPTDYPDDYKFYSWNEATTSWDAFQPYASWVLNEDSGKWAAPVDRPNDGKLYSWNEVTTSWDEVES
mgnify:FL=1